MALRYTAGFDGYNAYTKNVHSFDVEIYDVNYTGEPKEITMGGNPMNANIQNTNRDSFPTLLPSFIDLNLIATEAFQLNEMYTDDEKALKVSIKMDNTIYGYYFVIPDGTSESFIDPPYDVTVRCTDGLGLLSGYDYPTTTGKASVLEVIAKCLDQLGLNLNINTYSTIHYQGMPSGSDVYLQTIINQEQFANDKGIAMSCDEVLESLLSEWVSGLVQMNGEWYLFRWPDIVRGTDPILFKKYNSELSYLGVNSFSVDGILGTNEGDIIHCEPLPTRAVNMPYKRVAIRYEYGFLLNLLDKDTSDFQGSTSTSFEGWNKNNSISAVPKWALAGRSHAIINGVTNINTENRSLSTKDPIFIEGLSKMRFELTFSAGTANGVPYIIALWDGTKFLNLTWDDKWVTSQTNNSFSNYLLHENGDIMGLGQIVTAKRDFTLPEGLPSGAYLRINIFPSLYSVKNVNAGDAGIVRLYDAKVMALSNEQGILSETHTIENNGNYTKVPDTIEVINGETDFYGYKGTMYKEDGITLTDGFKQPEGSIFVDFLELAARDILFQHGKPMNRYEGSVLGIFNFLSRYIINGLSGIFMPTSLSVDFKNCISDITMSEVSNTAIPHTVLPVIYEYEETNQEGVKNVQ